MHFLTELQKTTLRDQLLLMAVILATRWCFRSNYLFHMDSINFALGMQHFDPSLHQPHPPGYYLSSWEI